jgi:hypothetical protein
MFKINVKPLCYLAFLSLSFFFVGSSLVIVAWLAVDNGSVATVGKVFFLSSFTGVLVATISGTATDSRNKKVILRSGLALQTCAVLTLLCGVTRNINLDTSLYAFSVLNVSGMAIQAGAVDSLYQSLFVKEKRLTMSVRISLLRQIGLAIGMGSTGILLDNIGSYFCISLLLIVMIFRLILNETIISCLKEEKVEFIPSTIELWKEGIQYAISDKKIFLAMLGMALTFSVAQMTNVLIPGFVHGDLSEGSEVYGLLEMSWSVGGGAILFLAIFKKFSTKNSNLESYLLCFLGISMIIFSSLRSVPIIAFFYAIMGGLFSLTKALFDGKILTFCSENMIGRIRAASSMLINLTGMFIYLIPSIIEISKVSGMYAAWGVITFLSGLIFGYLSIPIRRQTNLNEEK